MIRYLLFYSLIIYSISKAEDNPKNIISDNNNNIFMEQDNERNDQNIQTDQENNRYIGLDKEEKKTSNDLTEKKNNIVIKDIPNKYNLWHGILSSDDDGLGWMMWGNTNYITANNLLNKVNPIINSPTLANLYKNILLSRAKGPKKEENNELNILSDSIKEDRAPFLEKKIGHLVQIGFSNDVNYLLNSIPQEIKGEDFEKGNFKTRLESYDIPFICENISELLSKGNRSIFHRKALIVCKLILKKDEEAMLAIKLLENDLDKEDNFLKVIRDYFDKPEIIKIQNIKTKDEDYFLLRILIFRDYKLARTLFKENKNIFHKTIYDMQLFSKKIQIESLEYLVNFGIYDSAMLLEEYNSLVSDQELDTLIYNKEQDIIENTVLLRAKIFKLIRNSISKTDRAKNLMLLWKLADEKNIFKAIALVTRNVSLSLSPDETLYWLNSSIFKALLLVDEVQAAKKWIFYGTTDVRERATIDISFCKLLVLLYIYDRNTTDLSNNVLDIDYLVKILRNDVNIEEENFLRLLLTLKALGEEVSYNMWKVFLYNKKFIKSKKEFIREDASYYFLLDGAVRENNLAEAALISVHLLQKTNNIYVNQFNIYKGLQAIDKTGLRSYARDYAVEKNIGFLTK